MRARPKLRNSLLLGMAAFASRLPEDYPEVSGNDPAIWRTSTAPTTVQFICPSFMMLYFCSMGYTTLLIQRKAYFHCQSA